MKRLTISKYKLKATIVLSIFLILVFFYDFFIQYLSFTDEIIALLFLMAIPFAKNIKLLKQEYYIIGLFLIILILGLVSNLITPEKIVLKAIGIDLVSFYKAFVVYFGVRILFKEVTFGRLYPKLKKGAIILLWVIFFLLIADNIFYIFYRGYRFGLPAFELFFKHPSRLSFAISFIFIVLFPYYAKHKKKFLSFILLLGFATLRVKYFGFVIVALFILYNRKVFARINKKVFYVLLAFTLILFLVLFKDWLLFYFSETALSKGWSRAILLKYSFIISRDFFPFGTGFGSYASYASGTNYSWVYGYYHLDGVWGISKKHYMFTADQYWPMVLGQFGVFGLLAMLSVIYLYINIFLRYIKTTVNEFLKNSAIAALLGLFLLLIDSSSDAIFSQNRGVVVFLFMAIIINQLVLTKNENITNK